MILFSNWVPASSAKQNQNKTTKRIRVEIVSFNANSCLVCVSALSRIKQKQVGKLPDWTFMSSTLILDYQMTSASFFRITTLASQARNADIVRLLLLPIYVLTFTLPKSPCQTVPFSAMCLLSWGKEPRGDWDIIWVGLVLYSHAHCTYVLR